LRAVFPDGVARTVPTGYQTDGWWKDTFPTWHREVFALFAAYLAGTNRPFRTYLGFGEWVGPTALYASTYVDRVFALEPDPLAHKMLVANVAANPDVGVKTHTSRMCIAATPGTLKLRGGGASGSFLDGVVNTKDTASYASKFPDAAHDVTCVPLAAYMDEHNIEPGTTFIKVDTEGAEWTIVPSLLSWLSSLGSGKKPTFVISLHKNSDEIISQAAPVFMQVARLFKNGGIWPPLAPDGQQYASGVDLVKEAARFTSAPETLITEARLKRCSVLQCDIVLSDL